MYLSLYAIHEYSSINALNMVLKPFLSKLKSLLFSNKDCFLTQNNKISFLAEKTYTAYEYLHFSTYDLLLINQNKTKKGEPF